MEMVEFNRPDGRTINIEIIRYEAGDENRNRTPDRHRHNFHSIFFILDGVYRQEVDFVDYSIGRNQVMIIPKGAIHWEKEMKSLDGYVILFNDSFFSIGQKVLLNGFLKYAIAARKLLITLTDEESDNLVTYFELLYTEQFTTNQNQTFLLQNLMLALLNKMEGFIQNFAEEQSFITTRKPFQHFIELVEENFHKQKDLAFYTNELQLTPRKLNKVLREIAGSTASNFIIDRIILEAKRELCYGEKSVKEIAFLLGYESQYYFSRIFKKRTNMSPEQFRNEFAE